MQAVDIATVLAVKVDYAFWHVHVVVFDHGVEDHHQFSHTRHECDPLGFSVVHESLVERFDLGVKPCGNPRGHEQGVADRVPSAAGGGEFASHRAAVAVRLCRTRFCRVRNLRTIPRATSFVVRESRTLPIRRFCAHKIIHSPIKTTRHFKILLHHRDATLNRIAIPTRCGSARAKVCFGPLVEPRSRAFASLGSPLE